MSPLNLEAGVAHGAGSILSRKLLLGKARNRGMRAAEAAAHPTVLLALYLDVRR
jgi:hypothetical protein